MPFGISASFSKIAKLSAAAFLLSATTVGLAAPEAEPLGLEYLVTFANGSLDPQLDQLGVGSIKPGNTQHLGIDATWTAGNGMVVLGVTRPSTPTTGAVASGLFATPVNFGTGSIFAARATFRAPTGPHLTGNQFAVVLAARAGDEDDYPAETRVAASFQVRGATARLNVPGSIPMSDLGNVPQEVYDAIFNSENPQPFTLELRMDRVTGVSTASLKAGDYTISYPFQSVFSATSGAPISAVGTTIAIASGSGQRATVEVMDLKIFKPKADSTSSATSCDPAWAEFACRQPPSQ